MKNWEQDQWDEIRNADFADMESREGGGGGGVVLWISVALILVTLAVCAGIAYRVLTSSGSI